MFQLIYLTFTQPRADKDLFSVMTSQTKIAAGQPAVAAGIRSSSRRAKPRCRRTTSATRPMTPELIDQMNLEKSLAFYKDRFADASDFTFVFVGSFDDATMRPLVEQYLGALPSLRRKETWKDVGIDPPKGVVERRVEKGIEPKSQASIVFTGPFQYDQAQRVAIRAMAMVLETRLREILREDLGGTYSVGASASYSKLPDPEYRVVDRLRLQPRSDREPGEDRVQGDRAAEGRAARRRNR